MFDDFDGEKTRKTADVSWRTKSVSMAFLAAQDFLLRALHGGQPLPGTKLGIDKGGGHSF